MIKRFESCACVGEEESMEVPGLKTSYNIALIKWQENGFPAENGFPQRAACDETMN